MRRSSSACSLAMLRLPPRRSARRRRSTSTYGETYVERDSGPLEADVYVPRGRGAVSRRAGRPRRRVADGHPRRSWPASPMPGRAWLHGRGDQLPAGARSTSSPRRSTTARRPSAGCAPNAARVEDRSRAHRRLRLLGRRPPGGAAGHDRCTTTGSEGVADPTSCPSTRLQAVVAGGAPCDFRPMPADVRRPGLLARRHAGEMPEQYRLASPAAFIYARRSADVLLPRRERPAGAAASAPTRMRGARTRPASRRELYVVPKLGHIGVRDWTATRSTGVAISGVAPQGGDAP